MVRIKRKRHILTPAIAVQATVRLEKTTEKIGESTPVAKLAWSSQREDSSQQLQPDGLPAMSPLEWSVQDVQRWLDSIGLRVAYGASFAECAVDGAMLMDDAVVSESELKGTLGVQEYAGHNYTGHNYIGRNTIGHGYIGHNYVGVQNTLHLKKLLRELTALRSRYGPG